MGKNEAMTSYAFDVSDDRRLVGFADDVFVGRVLGSVGEDGLLTSDPNHRIAQTQFAVEVLENIKGELDGVVKVNQLGGYQEYTADRDDRGSRIRRGDQVRELVLFDGDPLLETGRKYLLVTKWSQREGWHEIAAAGFGDIPLGDQEGAACRVVDRFRRAAERQLGPLEPDPRAKPPSSEEDPGTLAAVVLTSIGARKVRVAREVMAAMGFRPMKVKALLDTAPVMIAEELPWEQAKALAARLGAAGAAVEVRR